MKISLKDVEHVAGLARLNLTEEETEKFSRQLSDVLENIEKLNELKPERTGPGTGSTILRELLREDSEGPVPYEGDLMANAPEKDKGHFTVPKII